eukprot:319489-Chlamydomonas_euryale.AAC.3
MVLQRSSSARDAGGPLSDRDAGGPLSDRDAGGLLSDRDDGGLLSDRDAGGQLLERQAKAGEGGITLTTSPRSFSCSLLFAASKASCAACLASRLVTCQRSRKTGKAVCAKGSVEGVVHSLPHTKRSPARSQISQREGTEISREVPREVPGVSGCATEVVHVVECVIAEKGCSQFFVQPKRTKLRGKSWRHDTAAANANPHPRRAAASSSSSQSTQN